MAATPLKASGAFRTIGEVSSDTGVAQHVLRYWEARFPQLRPVTRAGNRRYYRPADVALVRRIDALLNRDGYTMKGAQHLLAAETGDRSARPAEAAIPDHGGGATPALAAIRDRLRQALADD